MPKSPPLLALDLRCRLAVAVVLVVAAASAAPAQMLPRFRVQPAITVPIGDEPQPQAYAIANLNDDLLPDIVTIDAENTRIVVYINRGVGGDGNLTFDQTDYQIFPADGGPFTPIVLAIADVLSSFGSDDAGKPDGKLDILVAGDEMTVLPGRGDGTFDLPDEGQIDEDALVGDILGIVVDDFDGSPGLDLAILDDVVGVTTLCNDNAGRFALCGDVESIDVGVSPIRIVGGDFNADAKRDVAVLDADEQVIYPLFGNGDATFDEVNDPIDVAGEADGATSTDLAVAKIDGDTTDDLVIINDADNFDQLGVTLLGRRPQNFSTQPFTLDFNALALAAADLDGDDATDAITSSSTSGSLSVHLGDGNGEFSDSPEGAPGTQVIGRSAVIQTAELGGDRRPDLVVLNSAGTELRIAINITGEPTPTGMPMTPNTPTVTPTGSLPPTSTATGTATPTPTRTATATATPIPTANYGHCEVQMGGALVGVDTGRLDSDGSQDIAVADRDDNAVRILFNTSDVQTQLAACAINSNSGTMTLPEQVVTLDGPPTALAIVRDAIAVTVGNSVRILRRNQDGQFTETQNIALAAGANPSAIVASYLSDPNNPSVRSTIKLNSDSEADLVVINSGTRTVSQLYGQSNGTFTAGPAFSLPNTVNRVTAGDFNGDNLIDLVVTGPGAAYFVKNVGGSGSGLVLDRIFANNDARPIVAVAGGFFSNDLLADVLIVRGGDNPVGEVYVSSDAFRPNGSFAAPIGSTAGGIGGFDGGNTSFDAVVAGATESKLQFAYSDGNGGFPGPVVMPFEIAGGPVALAVSMIDGDTRPDVVTANQDGTISILVSKFLPPTPTPTVTLTPTITETATPSSTPSVTPTDTPTGTPLPTGTITATGTATRTMTPSPAGSATPTRGGFALSSCAIDPAPVATPWPLLGGAALFVAAGLGWRRGSRRTLLGLTIAATALHAHAASAALPTYLPCQVSRSVLGTSANGLGFGALSDVSRDGVPDLVLLDAKLLLAIGDPSELSEGSCATAFTLSSVEVTNPNAAAVGQINADTIPDLAISTESPSPLVAVFTGDASGAFVAGPTSEPLEAPGPVAILKGSRALVVGDSKTLKILRQSNSGTYTAAADDSFAVFSSPISTVRLADFDGDGDQDIAAIDAFSRVYVFVQQSNGKFLERGSFDAGAPLSDLEVTEGNLDLDDDGVADLAVLTNEGQLLAYTSVPGATLSFAAFGSEPTVLGPSAKSFAFADLDGDGVLDIAAADSSAGGRVQILTGDGTAFTAAETLAIGASPSGIRVGLLDGDSLDDIVTTNANGTVSLFFSSNPAATPTFTPSITPTQSGTPTPTASPTETPTETPTATPTATGTVTSTGTATRTYTPTPGATATVTNTFGGFQVMGEGCANIGGGAGGGGGGVMPLAVLGLLALVRRLAAR